MSEAFWACSIGSQFRADAAVDGITLRFSEGAASENGYGSTKREEIVHTPAGPG